ncbi:MAG: DUF547 domain-containing protein [Planctomycetes bacterium]|nr:DUF547 domain-containing protein [Planctomycetota bacterium]
MRVLAALFLASALIGLGGCGVEEPETPAPAPAGPFLEIAAPERIEIAWREPFAKEWNRETFDHAHFGALLNKYIDKDGLVDYAGFQRDEAALDEYLYRLQHTEPIKLASADERYAFWINAYNAFTLKVVLVTLPEAVKDWDRYSLGQVKSADGVTAWKATHFRIGTEDCTLDRIENGILRPTWKDGRVHAAVNCASMSCPRMQPFAFEAARLQEQLDEAARSWVNDPLRNRACGPVPEVSAIFKWYASDFPGGARAFLARFAEREEDRGRLAASKDEPVRFLDYSWALNRQGSFFAVPSLQGE